MMLWRWEPTTSLKRRKVSLGLRRIIPAGRLTPAARPGAARQLGGAGLRAVAWVLVLTLLAGIGFVALNVGSLEERRRREDSSAAKWSTP